MAQDALDLCRLCEGGGGKVMAVTEMFVILGLFALVGFVIWVSSR